MTAKEVAKRVMKETGKTYTDIAAVGGLAGASSIGTFMRSKSMRVDNLLLMLNACGYELVARSTEEGHPEYVIGTETDQPEVAVIYEQPKESDVEAMVRRMVAAELAKLGVSAEVRSEPKDAQVIMADRIPEKSVSENPGKIKKAVRG